MLIVCQHEQVALSQDECHQLDTLMTTAVSLSQANLDSPSNLSNHAVIIQPDKT